MTFSIDLEGISITPGINKLASNKIPQFNDLSFIS